MNTQKENDQGNEEKYEPRPFFGFDDEPWGGPEAKVLSDKNIKEYNERVKDGRTD